MFGKDGKEESVCSEEIIGYIGKGMAVEGKVTFEGTVRVDGKFKGEFRSSGTLHVGEGAVVEAELNVDKAIISGEVRGVVNAASRVELKAPGRVIGEIRTPTLIVGEGVIFEGNCVMTKKGGQQRSEEGRADTGEANTGRVEVAASGGAEAVEVSQPTPGAFGRRP